MQIYCEQEVYPDGALMSQAKVLEVLIWLAGECSRMVLLLTQQCEMSGHSIAVSELCSSPAIPNNGLVLAVIYPCHLKEVCREQFSQGLVTSDTTCVVYGSQAPNQILPARLGYPGGISSARRASSKTTYCMHQ